MPTAPSCADLIPLILERAPDGLVDLICRALEYTLAREDESWLPWLILWPDAGAFAWAPSSRVAMGTIIGYREHPASRMTGGHMWNVGKVISEILDGMDWNGTLKG